jgi:hypothetical protein
MQDYHCIIMQPRRAKVDNSILLSSLLFMIGSEPLKFYSASGPGMHDESSIGQGKRGQTFDAIVCFPYFSMV